MLSLIKKTMLTGIGFALKTWDEVENKANEISNVRLGFCMYLKDGKINEKK